MLRFLVNTLLLNKPLLILLTVLLADVSGTFFVLNIILNIYCYFWLINWQYSLALNDVFKKI